MRAARRRSSSPPSPAGTGSISPARGCTSAPTRTSAPSRWRSIIWMGVSASLPEGRGQTPLFRVADGGDALEVVGVPGRDEPLGAPVADRQDGGADRERDRPPPDGGGGHGHDG